MSDIEDIYSEARQKLAEHQMEIERRLSVFGLSLSDVPYRLRAEIDGSITTYYFDNIPIFETEIKIVPNAIHYEIRPL